jgi:hypothetical protein
MRVFVGIFTLCLAAPGAGAFVLESADAATMEQDATEMQTSQVMEGDPQTGFESGLLLSALIGISENADLAINVGSLGPSPQAEFSFRRLLSAQDGLLPALALAAIVPDSSLFDGGRGAQVALLTTQRLQGTTWHTNLMADPLGVDLALRIAVEGPAFAGLIPYLESTLGSALSNPTVQGAAGLSLDLSDAIQLAAVARAQGPFFTEPTTQIGLIWNH